MGFGDGTGVARLRGADRISVGGGTGAAEPLAKGARDGTTAGDAAVIGRASAASLGAETLGELTEAGEVPSVERRATTAAVATNAMAATPAHAIVLRERGALARFSITEAAAVSSRSAIGSRR